MARRGGEKWLLNVKRPAELLGWKPGDTLRAEVGCGELILRKTPSEESEA